MPNKLLTLLLLTTLTLPALSQTNAPATIVLAASNSPQKSHANITCPGTADQVCINHAIDTLCPKGGPSGVHGCRIVLLNGIYNLTGPIILDDDDISFEGEQHCMWGGYNGAWTTPTKPAGTIGTGCSQIRATLPGFDLIQIQHTYVSSNGGDKGRHRGINIEKLYLVGANYSNVGIATKGFNTIDHGGVVITGGCCAGDDNVTILDNVIQRTQTGIAVFLDTIDAERNSIQDISGTAMALGGNFGRITNNLLFDVGGGGIISNAMGAIISNNLIGSTWGGPAVSVYGHHTIVANNSLFQTSAGAVWLYGVREANITGNLVNNRQNYGSQSHPNLDAFRADEHTQAASFTGNSCDAQDKYSTPTGFCIHNLGTGGIVTGNTSLGNWHGDTPFSTGTAATGANYPPTPATNTP